MKPFLWAARCLVWLAPTAACPRWLVKLALKLIEELVKRSRVDADALFAMDVLETVHGGGFPMFRDRIILEMCREPDEEHTYYSSVPRGNMSVVIYRLPRSPWQKGLIVNRESRVRIGVSPDYPTTNRADHGAPGPRSAAHAPSSRSGGRSAPPPAPTRGPGGSAACPRP